MRHIRNRFYLMPLLQIIYRNRAYQTPEKSYIRKFWTILSSLKCKTYSGGCKGTIILYDKI